MSFVDEKTRVKVFKYWFVDEKLKRLPYKIDMPRGMEKNWIKLAPISIRGAEVKRANWHTIEERYSLLYYSNDPYYRGILRGTAYITSCGRKIYEDSMISQKKLPFVLRPKHRGRYPPKGVCPFCYILWKKQNKRREAEAKKRENARHMTRVREKRQKLDREE